MFHATFYLKVKSFLFQFIKFEGGVVGGGVVGEAGGVVGGGICSIVAVATAAVVVVIIIIIVVVRIVVVVVVVRHGQTMALSCGRSIQTLLKHPQNIFIQTTLTF